MDEPPTRRPARTAAGLDRGRHEPRRVACPRARALGKEGTSPSSWPPSRAGRRPSDPRLGTSSERAEDGRRARRCARRRTSRGPGARARALGRGLRPDAARRARRARLAAPDHAGHARARGPLHAHGLPRARRARGRARALQLRGAQHPARPPGARHAGHVPLRPRRASSCCARTPRRCRCARWSAWSRRFRAIVPGKVFRNETTDAIHEHTFHQMEGLVVDRDVSVGHLIGAMKTLLRGVFGREHRGAPAAGLLPVRRAGLRARRALPVLQGGLQRLQALALDRAPALRHGAPATCCAPAASTPSSGRGFAFGLGLSRLVMLRYGIDDMRLLLSGDLRFLEQF